MKNKNLIPIIIIVVALIAVLIVTVVSKNNKKNINIDFGIEGHEMDLKDYETKNPVVAMNIDYYGTIVMELYPEIAENTVNNFIALVRSGFYDNNTMHRLMPGFVLQGGDPTGTGSGGPGYSIKGEFSSNGYTNNLKHEKGVLSMARATNPDSAGSQFFIMLGKADYLDGNYAAFGKVIDGMDVVDRIAKTERVADPESGKLANNLVIVKTIVDFNEYTPKPVEKVSE